MNRHLVLGEHQTRAFAPLPRPVLSALAATGALRVSVDLDGRTVLASNSQVGVLCVGDVQVRINPKLPVHRLLWLVAHLQDPSGWRLDDVVELEEADDLVTAVAVSFLAAARRALARGLLRGYRRIDTRASVMRGRLRASDQFRHRFGAVLPLEIRHDDHTADVVENRILRTAAHRLSRIPGLPTVTRSGLRRITADLGGVAFLPAGSRVPGTIVTRLNRHYQPVLRLARLALAGVGIDHGAGEVAASGFLFDLDRIFELWLSAVLRESLAPFGGVLHDQYATYLDAERTVAIRPDLVWEKNGHPAAVVDAKYKRANDNRDLYQMLAYCTALGLSEGHLVYAAGVERSHTLHHAGTRIHIWTVDLDQSVDGLRADIARISAAVVQGEASAIR